MESPSGEVAPVSNRNVFVFVIKTTLTVQKKFHLVAYRPQFDE
jgi:hypothetical protein